MRILHIITTSGRGGAEMMLGELVSTLHPRHDQMVVCLRETEAVGKQIAEIGVPVHGLRMRRGIPTAGKSALMLRLACQFQPQVIHGWMIHGSLAATAVAQRLPGNPPVIWAIHQSLDDIGDHPWTTRLAIRAGRLLSRRPAAIVYVSQTGERQHKKFGFCSTKNIVIPNGIDCTRFRSDPEARLKVRRELGVPPDAVLVGLVARWHTMKDHANFVQAAGMVAKRYPQAYFLLAGYGVTAEQPPLVRWIGEQNLGSRMLLLGERADIERITLALDLACSASSWGEAFSIAIGEALACGVPCVVTDVGDNAFLVGESGIVVPPRNSEKLANAISGLIEAGAEHRHLLGARARQRMEREFSLPTMVSRYEQLYLRLAGEDRPFRRAEIETACATEI